MDKLLRNVAGLFSILFIVMGIGWFVIPEFIAAQLGMPLLERVGLSTQIGDLGAFFITLGTCIFLGLRRHNRIWFYPAIMLLSIAATGRILAWLFHGASLALDMIAVEFALSLILLTVAKNMTGNNQS